jgi:hypothetical protein
MANSAACDKEEIELKEAHEDYVLMSMRLLSVIRPEGEFDRSGDIL